MAAQITEIAPDIFEISVLDQAMAQPGGFSFNQFLLRAEEPLLYHTGMRRTFPDVLDAVRSLINVEKLRWIMFAHVEDDECGALRDFLNVAPSAQVAHGGLGRSTIADLCDVKPIVLQDGEAIDLGGKTVVRRIHHIDTPHVPHNWESCVIFEETTGTLFCGDLGTQVAGTPVGDW